MKKKSIKNNKQIKKVKKNVVAKFNETLPHKLFKQTKIKNLPPSSRTIYV